jgi:hypothetical protein
MFNLLIMLSVGVSLAVGLFVFFKPAAAIEFQRRFYEKINWRVEPISMPKEIRNTKIMGLFLVVISVAVVVYIVRG